MRIAHCTSHFRHRAGFTLLELLVVIAIILTLAVAIVPNIGAGISGTQLGTASRSLLQAVRYARTMAILHQIETELVLVSAKEGTRGGITRDGKPDPDGARIEVRVATGALRANASGDEEQEEDEEGVEPTASANAPMAGGADDFFLDGTVASAVTAGDAVGGSASTGAALGDFAEMVHSVFPCGGVAFEFVRFTDEGDDAPADATAAPHPEPESPAPGEDDWQEGDGDDLSGRTLVFVFDSDGTCRPFDILLKEGGDEEDAPRFAISVDRWGRGKIEGRDDD